MPAVLAAVAGHLRPTADGSATNICARRGIQSRGQTTCERARFAGPSVRPNPDRLRTRHRADVLLHVSPAV